ncbi:hypothetical protein OJF2_52120 [Aquisphaera giovannonii]|uniref:Glycine zipper domain-containing protein n=1 Tax=Aquisphaera giovannonii TaxID=406548 RepID=A0A5B9W8D2_9BACT|nr:hypothetical protein [Aquisphaera giovannonii]QEH36627.1 hypothetical protein OJF2_52120 [Aquisphaera giovannonii]
MKSAKDPEKSVDVPPTGSRNPDPITNAPGSHPVETGIGAAVGGAASGAAIGSVAGPVGTAVGAAIGAVAGGYAGKGIGELIDPTTEDNWLRDNFSSRSYGKSGRSFDDYRPAYHYGAEAESKYPDRPYHELERDLESGWASTKAHTSMAWHDAKDAVRDAYDRARHVRSSRASGK